MRGVSSVLGAIIIVTLLSTSIATLYYASRLNSSVIRSEADKDLEAIRKGSEFLDASYSETSFGLNITVVSHASFATQLKYLLLFYNDDIVDIRKLGIVLEGGESKSILISNESVFTDLYLVTGLGNFIPVVKKSNVSRASNSGFLIINDSIGFRDNSFTMDYIPPYTLLLVLGGEWIQLYMDNLSVVHSGDYILQSLDGRLEYLGRSGLLFLDGRFLDLVSGTIYGLGLDYLIFKEPYNYVIYFSNGTILRYNSSLFLECVGDEFWFLGNYTSLGNGSYITSFLVVSDSFKQAIYLKFYHDPAELVFRSIRLVNNRLYMVIDDGELLYTLILERYGDYKGHSLYSPKYFGVIGKKFLRRDVLSGWSYSGDLVLGYADNLKIFHKYILNQYSGDLPEAWVGPIAIYAWQNESSNPVSTSLTGFLNYRGSDVLGSGKITWFRFLVFNKKALYFPYSENFNFSIVFESSYVSYYFNLSIVGVHGEGKNSIFPIGWLLNLSILEVYNSPYGGEPYHYYYAASYVKRNYVEYPSYTWLYGLIGFRRDSSNSIEFLFIDEWGDHLVRGNESIYLSIPMPTANFSLSMILYSNIIYDLYVPLPDWPKYQVMAGLYVQEVLFAGGGRRITYIGPLKPRFTELPYHHYTDYIHSSDIVVFNNTFFSGHYWFGLNKSVIVVDPDDYPGILSYDYWLLIGFHWVERPPNIGFIRGYPGLYMNDGTGYRRLDWITDSSSDLAYSLNIYGDFLVMIEWGGSVWIRVFNLSRVGG